MQFEEAIRAELQLWVKEVFAFCIVEVNYVNGVKL